MVYQPDVEIESTTEVDYDPATAVAPQPEVEIESSTHVDYTPPASSGGQPVLVVTATTVVDYEAPVVTTNITGEAFIYFEATGVIDVDVEPVPIPSDLDFQNIKIISVTMPVPSTYDQFGRPIE